MDWKNNLTNVANKAADIFTTSRIKPPTAREQLRDRLEDMDPDDLLVEQVYMQHELLNRMEVINGEVARIRNNVVFFFWIFILSIVFWVFAFIIGGSILAAFGSAFG